MTAVGPGLKRLSIDLNLSHGTVITRLFEATGRTLTSLRIYVLKDKAGPDAYRFDSRTIVGWCPLVTSLFVKCPRNCSRADEQTSTHLSYVRQLKYTDMLRGKMDVEFLNCFLTSCPNVNVETELESGQIATVLPILGSRVRKLVLKMKERQYFPGLESAAAPYENVETLTLVLDAN